MAGAERPASVRDVDVRDAHGAVERGAFLLDVRSDAEFASGHAPAAVLIPLGSLAARTSELPRDRPICVICHAGGRSAMAAQQLVDSGFGDVRNVRGGMTAWSEAGLPVAAAERPDGFLQRLLSGRLRSGRGR